MIKVSVFLLLLFSGLGLTAQNGWSIYRGDGSLSGAVDWDLPSELKLSRTLETEENSKASPVVQNNILYCGDGSGIFYAFDISTGREKWRFTCETGIEAPALLVDGKVIFGSLDGTLWCLSSSTGEKIWEYQTDNQIVGSANYFQKGDQNIVTVGSYDYLLHGVNVSTGDGIWTYESNNFINGAPAVENKQIVFGGCDGCLHIVDASTGKRQNSIELETYIASSPAIHKGIAYVGDYEGHLFAIELSTGKTNWTFTTPEKELPFLASPAFYKGNVIACNEDRSLYCLDALTGKIRWRQKLANRINASAVVANRSIIAVTANGRVTRHNFSDGKITWNYNCQSPVLGSPALYEQKLIITCMDGRILIFE